MNTSLNNEYTNWIVELKQKIQHTQLNAALAVNTQLIQLYWELGKSISEKINKASWGSAVIEQVSKDLKQELPNQSGFSLSNLFNMKKFYEFYEVFSSNIEFIQQAVGQILWGQNITIFSKASTTKEAQFYIKLSKAIPKELKSTLPTIEEIEKEFSDRTTNNAKDI